VPSLKDLQLNWLRTFEAVGRHLSFSSAAMQLSMSQSAVSQQIRLLEQKLGQRLFVRRNRSIELSVAGRAYLSVVREALEHIEHGIEGIFNTVAQGVLELSVNNSFAQLWLAPRFRGFTALHPQVSVRMYGVNWEADAPPTSAELEIRYGRGMWPGFETTELLSRSMRPYSSRSLALEVRRAGGLKNLTLIDVLGTPVGWTDWIANYPLSSRESLQRIHVDSFAIAAEMAAQGVGVSLLSEELITGSMLHNDLLSPLDQSLNDQSGFYLLRPREKSISGAAKAFCAWLESERTTASSTKPMGTNGAT
jgi:LysR family glycine cleavage system transcriptional activator